MSLLVDGTGSAASPNALPALGSWVSIDAAHIHDILLGLASVAVVVWTAGFLVRALGHKPNRGLVAGMTYAQLAFMGALAAAFLTPLALQAVALMFLVLDLWQTPSIIYTWRRDPAQRTYGQQQILDLYGLTSGTDVIWYVALQVPYIAAIVTILIWPSSFVALPLLWIALYGAYQILTSFLYLKPIEGQPVAPHVAASASAMPLGSLKLLADTQRNITSLVENTAVAKAVFTGRDQDHTEAVVAIRSLHETSLALGQFAIASQSSPPPAFLLASGYVHAMIRHRALAGRLYALVIGIPYQPLVSINLLDEVRNLLFYDVTANRDLAQLAQFVPDGTEINIAIKDARLDTTTRSYTLSWLGEVYLEEVNAVLLAVNNHLVNLQPPVPPAASPAPDAAPVDRGVTSPTAGDAPAETSA